MKMSVNTVHGVFDRTWTRLCGSGLTQAETQDEPPLRSELFSANQMEQHGKILAGIHRLQSGRHQDQLLGRLSENEKLLLEVYNLLSDDVKTDQRITPAGEWLLDNFYLIEEQIRTAKQHLPKGYSRELPRLLNGISAGLPRVYDLALETISHGDGRVDPENLSSFVAAYQSETVLKLGELWAIPIMLRLALIENLRRVAVRIAAHRQDRNRATYWADQMTELAAKDPKSLILAIADMARSTPPMVSPFVAELTRRLHGRDPALALPLTWVEQRLAEAGTTIEQMVRSESQLQAADQVSMSNSIGSLRFLGAMDWREFVESMSYVELILGEDPGDVYANMDFSTRDRYRHVIEKTARISRFSESEVARKAIKLAHEGANRHGGDDRRAHVGFYLLDTGLAQLEQDAEARSSVVELLHGIGQRFTLTLYGGAILLATILLACCLVLKAYSDGLQGWLLLPLVLLSLACASHLAVGLINWLATILVIPHPLPRMDFSKGIPQGARTLVVVPTMLTSLQGIDELVKALEVRFLGNRHDQLYFGLLTDFRDALTETLPEDAALTLLAGQRIYELNEKYRSSGICSFFLFHRPRTWNPQDKLWMGYERKRGKLADLNGLLRGNSRDCFSLIVGETAVLSEVKYVITLDTDTQLARDSAWQFVGALAHPLNRPQFDQEQQRIVSGYGIIQPRVAVSLTGANRSQYARICTNEQGIDPYTRVVSDLYQDLFGEGSFIGKGIYDVDAFELVLGNRFPDNRILSHDLLEGCYARSGLMSDVQLYEEYPSSYSSDVSRRHRWIRGDWQIAHWLLPTVPGPTGSRLKNRLSLLSRWKIFDNLRRSLTAAALTLLLLTGWAILSSAWFWTLAVLGIILIPSLFASALNLSRKPVDVTAAQHLAAAARSARQLLIQDAFMLVCLPFEAFFSLDAIARTTCRMLFTHKLLLQWNPSEEADRASRTDLFGSCRAMWFSPALATATLITLALLNPAALAVATPILALWFVSPAIAWWLSRPITRFRESLTAGQELFLRKLSRKTWAFFETFVGPEDNWLPPDNFQEHPVPVIAHRTSPTNMGLALLANLAACDFGFISAGKLVERTTKTLHTMEGLERHRGHFYNWYDTQTLLPLQPLYISSVDSGNLAGHLLTLRPGLLELFDHRIQGTICLEGLQVTLEIVRDALIADTAGAAPAQFKQLQHHLDASILSRPATPEALLQCLDLLADSAAELVAILKLIDSSPDQLALWWANAFVAQSRDTLDELLLLVPWAATAASRQSFEELPGLDEIPTLRELAALEMKLHPVITARRNSSTSQAESAWLDQLADQIRMASQHASARITAIRAIALQCDLLARMQYDFLYDETRHLLAIGYNVGECRRDASYYDLLASEARFATFIAIAQGELPQESWFALGRLLTIAGGEPILLSWSGSMFEYLMPLLVMPTFEQTLLNQTCKAAVAWQIQYGKKRSVPWGISECGYNAIDVHLNYQYRAFGVPGLGLKRGLDEDLVIAPYASAMALMVAPGEACLNLQRLSAEGYETRYGFYEAIDYTPSRLPRGQTNAVVRSFMAHHQGMSLLSFSHLLLGRPMQRRFESDPAFRATLLLLQEQVPKATASYAHTTGISDRHLSASTQETPIRVFTTPATPNPEVQLLSNGRYHVMVTNAGGGYSRWKDLAVTRWHEDRTCDNWGTFCYIRDLTSKEFWSAAYQPTLKPAKRFEAIFSEGRAEFRSLNNHYDTHTEISVSPEDDIELRRIRITNRTRTRRAFDITSYAEVVLAPAAADALHPAFSNLFLQTEIIHRQQAILCTRRPRSQSEQSPWMLHLMAVHGAKTGEVSYETDRMQFIGRGNSVVNPQAMSGGADFFYRGSF